MEFSEIKEIVIWVIAILATIPVGSLCKKFWIGWRAAQQIKEDYSAAVEDGHITNEEKALLLDNLIILLDNWLPILQKIYNVVHRIIPFFKK